MYSKLIKGIFAFIAIVSVFSSVLQADNPNLLNRVDWNAQEMNTSVSGVPSNLKYFKYYDVMPDSVTLPIYKGMDVSSIQGKKLFVGYGTVAPDGGSCKYFPELGRTECLPWWRIEREYAVPDSNSTPATDFLKNLTMLYPPQKIEYCKEWKTLEEISAGKVTCTSYYDKRISLDCLTKPEQAACKVDLCSPGTKRDCTLEGSQTGETKTLNTPAIGNDGTIIAADLITGLTTYQYNCPAGHMPAKECKDTIYSVTYPYECKAPTSLTANDGEYIYCDNNPMPYYDNAGTITGFTSNNKCSNGEVMDGLIGTNGKQRVCPVNNYSQTQKVCTEPITQTSTTTVPQTINQVRVFHDYSTNILFGDEAGDIYSSDPSCLRVNTVEGSRQKTMTTHIVGSGNLDDDIYVIAHKSNGSYNKIYCNMQHNENSTGTAKKWKTVYGGTSHTGSMTITATLTQDTGEVSVVTKTISIVSHGGVNNSGIDLNSQGSLSVDRNVSFPVTVYSSSTIAGVAFDFGGATQQNGVVDSTTASYVNKSYNGDTLQCIDNNGQYTFDKKIDIESSDIVSIQEASEAENNTHETMFARQHYRSSEVNIDGVLAAPATFPAQFPSYPVNGGLFLKTWDNALSTLALMFPYAGAYDVYVYGGSNAQENKLLGQARLTIDDFKNMPSNRYIQLKMGQIMPLSPSISEGNKNNACRDDDFVDWGGGVWNSPNGSKGDLNGCSSPNDTYAKANSAYNIVVKDLLTGQTTPIPLVYPLPYPNRIYISRLNVVENRKYRCYDPFPDVSVSKECVIGAQNESSPISDYRNISVNLNRATTLYCYVTSEKVVGCKNETTVQNDGGITYQNADQYETIDNSGLYKEAMIGAQLSEQMMHIWSGWPGECEYGVFTDFSWMSDPMTLAGLALSAWSSMKAGADIATATNMRVDAAWAAGPQTVNGVTETAAQFSARIDGLIATADQASSSISATLYNLTQGGITSTTNYLTTAATTVENQISSMVDGVVGSGTATAFSDNVSSAMKQVTDAYDKVTTYATKVYDNTFNVGETLASQETQLGTMANQLSNMTEGTKEYADLLAKFNDATNQYAELSNSISGTIYHSVQNVESSISSLFTSPATADAAQKAGANTALDAITHNIPASPQTFMEKFNAINKIEIAGFGTIKWTEIASAGYIAYENIVAKQDEMLKAWQAQQTYVMSGQGTSNDIAANAYSSCMASVGAGFVNTISYAVGAPDGNTTSPELLDPTKHPMRISFQSLQGLKNLVGQKFLETSYMIMDLDSNIQMVTIVALNSSAYTQLTQMVCGGYQVSALANALNLGGNAKPSMMDALLNMSPQQAATMAAGVACSFAGPYSFACSLGLKLLTSFSSGNACTSEEVAQSQKPIQLKTNKFQKFGQCHFISTSCSSKTLDVCMRHKNHYCCYDQIMTRIFAEGVKEERGKDWSSCNDITINDLQYITFTPCQEGQDPYTNRCFPINKYNELGDALKKQIKKGLVADGDTFVTQVQNAMESVGQK